jgi:8-oxo-dGTP pyrophosphatase MutT (NUDIX family)
VTDEVRAAGALVWRPAGDERGVELLLIHRPKYDDWGWPKGKAEPGDTDDEANAVREVREETGYHGRLGPALGSIHYLDPRGRPKTVRYWAMELGGGEFTPNREVDQIAWLTPAATRGRLSHTLDREVLDRFLELCPG